MVCAHRTDIHLGKDGNENVKTTVMPKEKRAAYAGRHCVICGRPASERQNALVSGNGTLLLSAMGDPEHETLTLRREELLAP